MKKLFVLAIAALTALTMSVPAFAGEPAVEDKAAVAGSWILNQVFEVKEGEEPVLLAKEENQSLYGAGRSIFTFDEDGGAHDLIIDGQDMADKAGKWEAAEPGTFVYTGEDGMELTFVYKEADDTLHRTFEDKDFAYARAITGAWKLNRVVAVREGDAPEELTKEEHQSLYAEADNTKLFQIGGTFRDIIKDGPNEGEQEGTWAMIRPDQFVVTIGLNSEQYNYLRVEDTLSRDVLVEAPETEFPHLRFLYTREEVPAE